jgi:hypothetical protein
MFEGKSCSYGRSFTRSRVLCRQTSSAVSLLCIALSPLCLPVTFLHGFLTHIFEGHFRLSST